MKRAKQYPSSEIIIDAFKKEVSQQFQKHVMPNICYSYYYNIIKTEIGYYVNKRLISLQIINLF